MKVWTIFIISMLLFVGLAPGLVSGQDDELILRVAMQDDLKTTNPLLTSGDVWTWNALKWIYDSPVLADSSTGDIIPYIAVGTAESADDLATIGWDDCSIGRFDYLSETEWNDSSKPEAIVFYDFTDVYWHDGQQMDIRDIMFSFHVSAQVSEWSSSTNPLKDLGGYWENNYSADSWLYIDNIWESNDGLQAALKFNLQEPYMNFFKNTLSSFLLPYHIWGNKTSGQNIDGAKIWCDGGYDPNSDDSWQVNLAQAYDNEHPVGSGIFKWDHWEVGQLSKITAWRDHFYGHEYLYRDFIEENYPDAEVKQPTIDAMVFKIYKTSEAAILALRNDDIDYIAWSIPPTFLVDLIRDPEFAISQTPEQGFFYMGYNMRRQSFGYNESASFPYAPEDDFGKPLRRAISHCIDKDRIVQRLLLNFGIPGEGPINNFSPLFNNSIPRYAFDPNQAISILENASYVLDDPSLPPGDGNYWNNPDGSEIGSDPGGGIHILTPEANYDPIRAQAGLMIAQQLQDIGINAYSEATFFGQIVDRIYQSEYDMYILGWWRGWLGYNYPDFFYTSSHSSSSQYGQNYAGYQNESFDALIDLARSTGSETVREQCIMEAQASIAYDLPYDVLYFRTNAEAYRSDRFVGWEVGISGSIFNWQSIKNLRSPSPYKVNAQFVSPPSAVVANSTGTQITVFVKDQDGNPLSGAHVVLNASSGALGKIEGNTTSSGKFTTTFAAPYVDPNGIDGIPETADDEDAENGTQVVIMIKSATYSTGDTEYDPAPPRLTLITVYPEEVSFLSVSIRAEPDIIDPDVGYGGTFGFTYIEVEVTDQNGEPILGATVTVSVYPAIPVLTPISDTTDQDGKVRFILNATDLSEDIECLVTAYAEYIRYPNIMLHGDNSISVFIVDSGSWYPPPPPPPAETTYWNEAIILICGMSLVAVIYAAIYRKKK